MFLLLTAACSCQYTSAAEEDVYYKLASSGNVLCAAGSQHESVADISK
jgi:hypothetical protein